MMRQPLSHSSSMILRSFSTFRGPARCCSHCGKAGLKSSSIPFSSRPFHHSFPFRQPRRSTAADRESAPASNPKTSQPIQLRDYQEQCIQSVLSSLDKGQTRLGISLATGSGKTVIFTQLIARVKPRSPRATQTLILAHRRELVEQAARHCHGAYPDARVEVEMGALHASGTADITIASVQSLTSGDRLDKYDPARFKLVLVDEAHHIVAPGYLRVLGHFGLLEGVSASSSSPSSISTSSSPPPSSMITSPKSRERPVLVGVSATFSRFDGLRLGAAIDEIVYHRDYIDMIGEKWLSDVIFTTVASKADISRVRSGAHGDFQPGELSRAVNTAQVNELTVRSWLARAGPESGRRSTLVFCVDLAHVAGLTRAFRARGVDARFVTGSTPKVERASRLEAFRRGEFPVLVNCGVFTEGTDIPNVDCVVLARPTRSRNLLVQMIGRGMRLHPGKENCHVIDMVSSLETGIVTTPTLFGLDPSELVSAASVGDMRVLRERQQEQTAAAARAIGAGDGNDVSSALGSVPQRVTITDYDSVLDLVADTSGERHIRTISQHAWVQVGPDRYILSGPTGTYLRLEKTPTDHNDDDEDGHIHNLFTVWEVRALPAGIAKSPYAAPRELLQAATLSDAVHGADSYAKEAFPHMFVAWRHRWRDLPATQGQLDFLNRIRGEGREPLTAETVTKGRAADMITKIKHGARGRFADLEADRRRAVRREVVLGQGRERAERETVSVGPLPG